jgi:hypothetical protein
VITKQWLFVCDHPWCGRKFRLSHTTKTKAMAAMSELGWEVKNAGNVCYCPKHVKQQVPATR